MSELAVKTAKAADAPLMRMPEFGLFSRNFFNMDPFAMMRQMREEMDRMLRNAPAPKGLKAWTPAVEVKQKNGNLVVSAELPGIEQKDLKVKVIDENLVLEGERKEEKEEKKEGYYHTERNYGQFYRSIPMPEGAQLDKVAAQFTNGVLEVTVPVIAAKTQSRDIPVKT